MRKFISPIYFLSHKFLAYKLSIATYCRRSNHLQLCLQPVFYMGQFVQILNKGRLGRPCKGAGSFSKPYLLRTRDPNLRSAAFSQRVSQILMEIVPRTKKSTSARPNFPSQRGKLRKTRRKREYKDPPLSCVLCAAGVP